MSALGTETLAARLQMQDRDVLIVREILQRVIPGKRVWVFGSRATGRNLKQFSDLDLAVEGKLTWKERADLAEAFDESLLPMKVDVLELEMVDAEFRERIEKGFVGVQGAEKVESAA
jgi:predicted nucleotidyltransferase